MTKKWLVFRVYFSWRKTSENSELKGTLRKRHEKKEGNKKFSEQSNGSPLQNNNVKWPSSVLSGEHEPRRLIFLNFYFGFIDAS